MKLPTTIQILGMTYEVVEIEKCPDSEDTEAITWMGRCYENTCRIYIRKSLCDRKKLQVLLHEIAHCILWESGLSFEDRLKEESVVQCIANGFTHIFNELYELKEKEMGKKNAKKQVSNKSDNKQAKKPTPSKPAKKGK
jgi:hypothetical protein